MRRPAALCWMLGAAAIVATVLPAGWAHALEIKRVKLDNGMIVLISPQHNLPMVTAAIAFDAGARSKTTHVVQSTRAPQLDKPT